MAMKTIRTKAGNKVSAIEHRQKDASGVERVWWTVGSSGRAVDALSGSGSSGALIPGEWSKEHQRQCEAIADGVPFEPTKARDGMLWTPEQHREMRADLMEDGHDMTREISDWVRYLAREELDRGGQFGQQLDHFASDQWPPFLRESFGSLYGSPSRLAEPAVGSEWIGEMLDRAEALPSWERLKGLSIGDPWACGLAVSKLVEGLGNGLRDALKNLPESDPQTAQKNADHIKQLAGEDSEQAQTAQNRADKASMKATLAAGAVAERATEELAAGVEAAIGAVESVVTAMNSLGAGQGAGLPQVVSATPEEVRDALAKHPALQRVAKIAGRMRIAARKARKEKVRYVPEQIVDVTVGGELSRLLPSELMQLADPESELVLSRKLMERQALEYELEGTENVGQGPVILAVDASGSMSGPRYEWAMGIALALIEICMRGDRPFVFYSFDWGANQLHRFSKPKDVTLPAVLDMVLHSFTGGGTSIDQAIQRASQLVADEPEWKRADLILISDGDDRGYGNTLLGLKENQGVDTYGIAVGSSFAEEEQEALAGYAEVTYLEVANGTADVDVVFGI